MQPISQHWQSIGDHSHPIVDFDPVIDKMAAVNLSEDNKSLETIDTANLQSFQKFIDAALSESHSKFLLGGYAEERKIYGKSSLFDKNFRGSFSLIEEPRTVHLGLDIWGVAGTKIYAPLDGSVHSWQFNDNHGDYGATIILRHSHENIVFHTLYGHLSLADLSTLQINKRFTAGERLGTFGIPAENGGWPPHLHFQIIINMGDYTGDYPGVCKKSEKELFLANSPDPDVLLNLRRFTT